MGTEQESPLVEFFRQTMAATTAKISERLDAGGNDEAWLLLLFITFVQDPEAARVEIDAEMKRCVRAGDLKAMNLRRYAEMTKTAPVWPKWDARNGSLRMETYAEAALRHLGIIIARNGGHEVRNFRSIMHTMVMEGFFSVDVGEKYLALALAQRDAKK